MKNAHVQGPYFCATPLCGGIFYAKFTLTLHHSDTVRQLYEKYGSIFYHLNPILTIN